MNYFRLLFIHFTVLFSLLPAFLYSQVDTAWVRRYNGPGNGGDWAQAIAIDDSNNIYVTGFDCNSIVDNAYATIKYNSAGVQQWVQRYNSPGNNEDVAYAIVVDGAGNVYVTGKCQNDYTTIKYNSTGVQQWVAQYNGPGNYDDIAYAIAVDNAGNVYVTGLSSGNYYDYATIKYDSAGNQQWVARYNGPGNDIDYASAIAVDDSGNVYVTGSSMDTDIYFDYATIKYDSAGNQQWVARYNGLGIDNNCAHCLVLDRQNNVFVTGYSFGVGTGSDYATIKYSSDGLEQWVQRYNGSGNSEDDASYLTLDGQNNVYVTGYSTGLSTSRDYATIKYNSAGIQQWVQRYNGPGNFYDEAVMIMADTVGNVYVTGYSDGSGTGGFDYATIKYNSTGVQQWLQRYNGSGNYDYASAIAVDDSGNVYVTGTSQGDYATIKYVQTQPSVTENRIPLSADRLSLEIFPNPAKTYFTIRLPQMLNQVQHDKMTIKIFDVTGKMVREVKLPMGSLTSLFQRISLDGIKNGIYFIQVDNEMLKEKLVVTK